MCGIAGILSNKSISRELLKKMTDLMISRGPDAEGFHITQSTDLHIGFGHRRLKIIDLSDTANQPMIDNESGNMLIFNGEIYNFKEIQNQYFNDVPFSTHCDTEIILKCYMCIKVNQMEKKY